MFGGGKVDVDVEVLIVGGVVVAVGGVLVVAEGVEVTPAIDGWIDKKRTPDLWLVWVMGWGQVDGDRSGVLGLDEFTSRTRKKR